MARIKKWQLSLIIVLVIVVIIATAAITIWAVVFRDNNKPKFDYDSVKGFTRYDWYLGTDSIDENDLLLAGVNVQETFNMNDKMSTIEIVSNLGGTTVLQDNRLTNITGSEIVLKITDIDGVATEHKLIITNGVNVHDSRQLNIAINMNKAIVMQRDIALDDSRKGIHYALKSNILGNGFTLDPTVHLSSVEGKNENEKKKSMIWNYLFMIDAENIVIRDVYIYGVKQEDGAEVSLSDFAVGGMLIVVGSGKSVLVENCMLENANRQVFVSGGKATIKGSFIRNSADACVSIETTTSGKSDVTLENNLVANATVACVLVWGYSKIENAELYPVINIKGFLDMYNWKDRASAQIMPDHDPLAGLANPIIKANINNKDYDYFFKRVGGVDYAHLGILIIATGDLKANHPTISGYAESDYVKRKFPLPKGAGSIIKTCDVIGFEQKSYIEPTSKINSDIFAELKFGRRPK